MDYCRSYIINLDQVNEFKLWPSCFMDSNRDGHRISPIGLRAPNFHIYETPEEIHRRLGQAHILAQISNNK